MNTAAMIPPDKSERSFGEACFRGKHSSVQTLSVTVSPFSNVSGDNPLILIWFASCSAYLPLKVALKVPNFESDRQLTTAASNMAPEKWDCLVSSCWMKFFASSCGGKKKKWNYKMHPPTGCLASPALPGCWHTCTQKPSQLINWGLGDNIGVSHFIDSPVLWGADQGTSR